MITISYNVSCCKDCHFFSDREGPIESIPKYYCDKVMEEMLQGKDPDDYYYPDVYNEIWSKCPFKKMDITKSLNKIITDLSNLNK